MTEESGVLPLAMMRRWLPDAFGSEMAARLERMIRYGELRGAGGLGVEWEVDAEQEPSGLVVRRDVMVGSWGRYSKPIGRIGEYRVGLPGEGSAPELARVMQQECGLTEEQTRDLEDLICLAAPAGIRVEGAPE